MNLATAAEIVYPNHYPSDKPWQIALSGVGTVFSFPHENILFHNAEADWHESRQKYLTASNVPAAMGADRYVSPYTLARQYLGDVARDSMNPLNSMFAHRAEAILCEGYEMETGHKTIDPGEYTMFIAEDWPWLACTPDRLGTDGKEVWNVQCKAPYPYSKKRLEEEGLPERVIIQVHAEMMCLGLDRTDVLIFFYGDSNPLRIVTVERNDELVEQIAATTMEFWEKVQRGECPEIDGSESTKQTLACLHPDDSGELIVLPPDFLFLDAEYQVACQRVKDAKVMLDDAEVAKRRIENKFRDAMSKNTFASLPNAIYTLKTVETPAHMRKASKRRQLRRKELE